MISGNVLLLPIAKGDFQDANRGSGAAETVFAIGWNPQLVTGFGIMHGLADLHGGAIVENDPQFSATGMRLQAEPLAGLDHHQTHGDFLIVGVLLEGSPWSFD
jgi:hypothetical protein